MKNIASIVGKGLCVAVLLLAGHLSAWAHVSQSGEVKVNGQAYGTYQRECDSRLPGGWKLEIEANYGGKRYRFHIRPIVSARPRPGACAWLMERWSESSNQWKPKSRGTATMSGNRITPSSSVEQFHDDQWRPSTGRPPLPRVTLVPQPTGRR